MSKLAAGAMITLGWIGRSDAFWKIQCNQLSGGIARIDPLISPGKPSDHAHTIKGGSKFSMTSSSDDLRSSGCTSCNVQQDNSAYWTPTLYFKHSDGTLEPVTEAGQGHFSYYKYNPLVTSSGMTYPVAFPKGFSMIAGNTFQRDYSGLPEPTADQKANGALNQDPEQPWTGNDATQDAEARRAIGFNCLHSAGIPAEASLGRHYLPPAKWVTENCQYGLRTELLFPQCWNGKDVDTANHKDHVRYPNGNGYGASCPSGFETVLPYLFYETIWNTQLFANVPGDFVFSNGDETGYGYHGDFIEGWQEGVMTSALSNCINTTSYQLDTDGAAQYCPDFKVLDLTNPDGCALTMPDALKSDNVMKPGSALPGNVQITTLTTKGPAPKAGNAAPVPVANAGSGSSGSNNAVLPAAQGNEDYQVPGGSGKNGNAGASSSSSSSPAPAPTPPPPPPPAGGPLALQESTITTTYYTNGQEAVKVIVVAKEVTVYADAKPKREVQARGPSHRRRHLHHHQHHHAKDF